MIFIRTLLAAVICVPMILLTFVIGVMVYVVEWLTEEAQGDD